MTKQYIPQNTKDKGMPRKKKEECCDDHKEKVEKELTDDKKNKQFQILGDATFCDNCRANTCYKGLCSVCGIKSEEIRNKHNGNLDYLRANYSNHVNVA